jgi:hypothetical protein
MTVQQPEPLPDRWREMKAWVDELRVRRPAAEDPDGGHARSVCCRA